MSWKTPICQAFWKIVERSDNKIVRVPPKSKISEELNIPYIDDGKGSHLLDIYYPEGAAGKLPTVIDVHGGGLMYGNKELNYNFNKYIAEYGFCVVSINYTLAPEALYGEQIKEVLAAFKWVKENADNHEHIDADRAFAMGDSAGGFLVAHAALANKSETLCKYYKAEQSGLELRAIGLQFPMLQMNKGAMPWAIGDTVIGKGYKKKPYLMLEDTEQLAKLPPVWLLSTEEDMIKSSSFYTEAFLKRTGHDYEFCFFDKCEEHSLPHVFNIQHPEYKQGVEANDRMVKFFKAHM